MAATLETRWLGRMDYAEALALQESLVEERRAGHIGDTLLLLEHEPVYTIGRTRDKSSLLQAALLPHPVVEISRGGQATYHGPGQLVGYPLLDLTERGRDLHAHLRLLEELLIRCSQKLGAQASSREGLTGVWVEDRKLASIGVGVRKWISLHGFAINVEAQSLEGFRHITPCGLSEVVMSHLSAEVGRPISTQSFAELVAQEFQKRLADGGQ
ncbi:MAG: lipoyl(octanoyl) transferase LipB [Verrucomicrobiota bacterium]